MTAYDWEKVPKIEIKSHHGKFCGKESTISYHSSSIDVHFGADTLFFSLDKESMLSKTIRMSKEIREKLEMKKFKLENKLERMYLKSKVNEF